MKWFEMECHKVLDELKVDSASGLSREEAEKRLVTSGFNKISETPPASLFSLFIAQLKNGLIYVLLAAVIVTLIIGEYMDALIILLVVMLNATIGVVQANKAEQAIAALKQMTAGKAMVRRGGKVEEISTEKLVPGDIVLLEPGRLVPADLRLTNSINLQIDESALTGESVPTVKQIQPMEESLNPGVGDLTNMAFMSTIVTFGRGEGVVVGTGMETEIGNIADMLHEHKDTLTPLQKRLEELGRTLGLLAMAICGLILVVSLIQRRDFFDMFLTAISLAVAAIPEGLPAIVAIVLALGVTRMSKANAIVRKLPAVETLGSVSIVCTDKTGTLTQNRMKVTHYYIDGQLKRMPEENRTLDNTDENDLLQSSGTEQMMMKTLILCADATLENDQETGDPTEIAGLAWAKRYGVHWKDLVKQYERVAEKPFDSERKLMSTLNRDQEGYMVHTKGAVDQLFNITTHVMMGNEVVPLTPALKENYSQIGEQLSADALRVLGQHTKIQ